MRSYFPNLFENNRTQDVGGELRQCSLKKLKAIQNDEPVEVGFDGVLMRYMKADMYAGHKGVEMRFERGFLDMSIWVESFMGCEVKSRSVFEYYGMIEFIKNNNKHGRKSAKI